MTECTISISCLSSSEDVAAVFAATGVGVSEHPLGDGGMDRVTTSSEEAFERVARNFWAAIREEGLRVSAVSDAVRTVDVERYWAQCEPVLRLGSR